MVAVGLGPAAGALGVALYTVGYLGKLFYEAFEGVDPEVIEAVAARVRPPQLIATPCCPRRQTRSHPTAVHVRVQRARLLIMGFVGAGGIGFYLLGYLQLLQYQTLMTALLVTLVVVMAVDT